MYIPHMSAPRLLFLPVLLACACSTAGSGRSGLPLGAQPSLSYRQYLEAGREVAPEPDQQELARLERELQEAAPGASQAEAHLRLGELKAARWRSKPEGATLIEAVRQYDAAAKDRAFPRRDEALFQLGLLLGEARKEDHARQQLHRLIKEHEGSRRVPAAFLYFGEYFFGGGDFKHGREFFEKVTYYDDPAVHGFALYRLGWCWIHIGDLEKARTFFADATQAARAGRAGGPRQSALVGEAAQRDLDRLNDAR